MIDSAPLGHAALRDHFGTSARACSRTKWTQTRLECSLTHQQSAHLHVISTHLKVTWLRWVIATNDNVYPYFGDILIHCLSRSCSSVENNAICIPAHGRESRGEGAGRKQVPYNLEWRAANANCPQILSCFKISKIPLKIHQNMPFRVKNSRFFLWKA